MTKNQVLMDKLAVLLADSYEVAKDIFISVGVDEQHANAICMNIGAAAWHLSFIRYDNRNEKQPKLL